MKRRSSLLLSFALILSLLSFTAPHALSGGDSKFPLGEQFIFENEGKLQQMGHAMVAKGPLYFVATPGAGGLFGSLQKGKGRVDIWNRYGALLMQQLQPNFLPLEEQSNFGHALAVDGRTLLVSAFKKSYSSDPGPGNFSGLVCVYKFNPAQGRYSLQTVLRPPEVVDHGFFGDRCAVLDDGTHKLIAICALGEGEQGRVYLYEADEDGNFPETATHILNQANTNIAPESWQMGFGADVAFQKTNTGQVYLAVGAKGAYVYQKTPKTFAPDGHTPSEFGYTAAGTGATVILAENEEGLWKKRQCLFPNWDKTKTAGFTLDAEGDYLVVGAPDSEVFVGDKVAAGAALCYKLVGENYQLIRTIWPSAPDNKGFFGYSLDICANYLVIGQPGSWGSQAGRVFVYEIQDNDLVLVDLIQASDGNGALSQHDLGDRFGQAVAANPWGELMVSAPFSALEGSYGGGALYFLK